MKNTKVKYSFAEWCKDNGHEDWLSLWDYEWNEVCPDELSYGTTKQIYFICPDCGCALQKTVYDLTHRPFNCPRCGDGSSYPNKFVYDFLVQLQQKFDFNIYPEHVFEWSKKVNGKNSWKRYDFYVDYHGIQIIIEVHGEQHFNGSFYRYGHSTQYEISNDNKKKQLAIDNNILESNYIVIDARKSNVNWIKNSILECGLSNTLPFLEEDIDWTRCHQTACKSLVKVVSDLWNDGIQSTEKIAKIIGKAKVTVISYLKAANDIGWCIYDAKHSKQLRARPVLCVTNNYIFASENVCASVSEEVFGQKIHRTSINKVASGKRSSVYGLEFTFTTKEEFLKMRQKQPEKTFGDLYCCKEYNFVG